MHRESLHGACPARGSRLRRSSCSLRVVVGLGACGGSSGRPRRPRPRPVRVLRPPAREPSASTRMVCGAEGKEEIAAAVGVDITRPLDAALEESRVFVRLRLLEWSRDAVGEGALEREPRQPRTSTRSESGSDASMRCSASVKARTKRPTVQPLCARTIACLLVDVAQLPKRVRRAVGAARGCLAQRRRHDHGLLDRRVEKLAPLPSSRASKRTLRSSRASLGYGDRQ